MTFGLAYVQLVRLDDREQTLISNVWIRQKWYNYHLTWKPQEFNNITLINVDPKKIWLPDIVLYNNAKSGLGAGTMYQFKTKVALRYDGLNTWYSPSIIRTGCNIDITNFPFDEQRCDLHFGSWSFAGHELNIFRDREEADLAFYLESAEFNLLSATATRKIITYSCCPTTPYPNIIFTIHLRRQPGFFLFNVIIPSMVITFFAILTFTSPPTVGERISLAIESFLSLSFLCLMVADSIPVNSDVSPLITKFLITCMVMISAALALNLVSLNLNSHTPVPRWLKRLAFVYIGPWVGFCGGLKIGKSNLRSKCNRGTSVYSDKNAPCSENVMIARIQRANRQNLHEIQEQKELLEDKRTEYSGIFNELGKVISNMNDVIDRSTHEVNQKYHKDFWRCLAHTVDRMCLVMFGLSFIFVSAIMLLKGYGHQLNVQDGVR
ncbi:neuronal acetylcholine receptor subunit alpha-9-like isoform X2 [Hydractinia symbiolongicarpus]|nr:neuronal acetylcholine receptor subunit alpha-9-like isoform X2 [Hydractinia symbiolongicarpus]